MKVTGKGKKGILIINEFPSRTDDATGKYLSGTSGKIFRKAFAKTNIDLENDCYVTSAINCYTRTPNETHIQHCKIRLQKIINELQPRIIIPMGMLATKALLSEHLTGRITGIKITEFFGKQIPMGKYVVCPIHSPMYIQQYESKKVLYNQWVLQLKSAVDSVLRKAIQINSSITKDPVKACKWLKKALKAKEVTFDYETTGIKPQREGHKIACMSIAFEGAGGVVAYSFPNFKDVEFQLLWKRLMTSYEVGKIAHKIDFELGWTKTIMGYYPKNIIWDTCLASHCLDSGQKTSLKFQSFVELGVIGYDSKVDNYITKTKQGEYDRGDNSFNKIEECPIDDLLYYNALDSFYSHILYLEQVPKFDEFTLKGFKFFLEGAITLTEIQNQGMTIDLKSMMTLHKRLTKKINRQLSEIKDTPEYRKWNGKKELNLNSDTQLPKLLYSILGYKIPKGCEDNKTAEKTLTKIGTKFTKMLIPYRKNLKLRDTYLVQFIREEVSGVVYPFFNLHIPATFRSSSNSPNFQNLPKRYKGAKLVRDVIIPRSGSMLTEYDYSGVEVCISTCYHKDPNMIKYVIDPSTDMHRDTCCDLFFRTKETFIKAERQTAKNKFVFPAFYGSNYENIAPGLWDDIPTETKEHLTKNGIKTFSQFKDHVYEVERIFWDERFKVYADWKQKTWKDYQQKGYIELYTGFRIHGNLTFTQVTNYPIQGTAFHILLFSLNHIIKEIKKEKLRSVIIGQIHDAAVTNNYPQEDKMMDKIIYENGIVLPKKTFEWITVPLSIDKEQADVNDSWAYMKEKGSLKGEK